MNNKKLGTKFEKRFCEILKEKGYWVHFIQPDGRGAQPFDIIAMRDGVAYAFDCKTCKDHIFRIGRAEENQILAFDLWMSKGGVAPLFAVEHNDKIYLVNYNDLKKYGKVDLNEICCWE